VLFVAGKLNKSVDLEPFGVGAADFIYGGLGNDSLHGGAGNDGISGAEALGGFYANPATTSPIVYDPATHNFVGFNDAKTVQSLVKINGHALNFEATVGNVLGAAKIHDGEDAIFGDDGNDWLVGGTQSDHLYGGMGDDILNCDDNLETHNGLNDQPDEAGFADADTAFGGGGRDTLLGNTGADRLIDWDGEFNAYVLPFSPFGRGTVIRNFQPQVVKFLYDMSRSDGADRTRVGNGLGTADRNGEPFAELGLMLPGDVGYHDQTGGPDDPQAGNNPGGKKDTK
jgi:Ca2+-binding RTX toxin-like protein